MKITWLGQAGLLFETHGIKIIVDPYLSNSVESIQPDFWRRVPVDTRFFDISPDVILLTHDHLDHYDPETAFVFLAEGRKPMTVLCPRSVWQKARQMGGSHNYVEFNRHTEWSEQGICFRAVMAAHSDPFAIGVVIEETESGKTYYITGDTLYNREIFSDLPSDIDVVFLPINGVGHNMNATDGTRFAKRCGARLSVPYHVGMFDGKTPEIFAADNKLVLEIYKETEI